MAASTLELLRLEEAPSSRKVTSLSDGVRQHLMFGGLKTLQHIRTFMEHHVWCVWDFMSLLKSIQAQIAPTSVPWRRPEDCESARLINEIVVGEEGDDGPDGTPISHFEVYLLAMRSAGANTSAIERFLASMNAGASWSEALEQAKPPEASRLFVRTTLEICQATMPERVAAFTLGREEIIPGMFSNLVTRLASDSGGANGDEQVNLRRFVWYLQRHIDVDGSRHGPMSARLFQRVCLTDPATRELSLEIAARVLSRRLALWDAVHAAVA